MLIECDGAYYNELLKRKISGLKKVSQGKNVPILWVVATARRGERIREEIRLAQAEGHIGVMVLPHELTKLEKIPVGLFKAGYSSLARDW